MDEISGKQEQLAPVTAPPPLERLSDALQEIIKVVVGTHRKPPRRLKSFLNGTWFGHPLHPVLTGPATVNAPCYEVRVQHGQVEVKRASQE